MAELKQFNTPGRDPNWCPGCGDYGIWNAFKRALVTINIEPKDIVIATGIGCGSKINHWVNTYGFHGLHGRLIPIAQGIKLTNTDLTVIAVGGDGDGYSEGGNHFLNGVRKNINMTYFIQNNQIYGLTKGQTSPTSDEETKTKSTPEGSHDSPIHGLSTAIINGATFVARGFAGDMNHLIKLMGLAIQHKGFAFVEILQPCVTFNKVNTYDWYKQRVYYLQKEKHNSKDKIAAIGRGMEWGDKIPLGILYQEEKTLYENLHSEIKENPLVKQDILNIDISSIFEDYM